MRRNRQSRKGLFLHDGDVLPSTMNAGSLVGMFELHTLDLLILLSSALSRAVSHFRCRDNTAEKCYNHLPGLQMTQVCSELMCCFTAFYMIDMLTRMIL